MSAHETSILTQRKRQLQAIAEQYFDALREKIFRPSPTPTTHGHDLLDASGEFRGLV